MLWRRSYDTPPPPIEVGTRVGRQRRPALRPPDAATSCRAPSACKDVVHRLLPYWYDAIVPDLQAGETVLVAAHGNSLRALVTHLDGLSEEEVVGAEHPDRAAAAVRPRRRHAPDQPRRHLPRRGGRQGRRRGRRQPGPLSGEQEEEADRARRRRLRSRRSRRAPRRRTGRADQARAGAADAGPAGPQDALRRRLIAGGSRWRRSRRSAATS